MSSEVKKMNDNRNYQSEQGIKHIRVKEIHSLNIYYKNNHFVKYYFPYSGEGKLILNENFKTVYILKER